VVYLFLIGIVSTQSTIGQTLGYLLGAIGYIILLSYCIYSCGLVSGDQRIILSILALGIIFSITTIRSPTPSTLTRFVIFIPLLFLNLVLIPICISQEMFYGTLARITAILTLIGLPTLIVGSVGPIQAYPVISKPLGFPVAIPGLKSIFDNPNTMGAIAVYGTLAALWEYITFKKSYSFALLLINSGGVYFSQGRAAALALLAGLTIVAIYYFTNRRTLVIVTVSGFLAAPAMILIKLGVIPGPGLIRNIDLNNRVHLWTATFRTILDRPLLGWGIGNVSEAMEQYIAHGSPHNSFLRMFSATGIIGGAIYFSIYLKAISKSLVSVAVEADVAEYGLVLGVAILHTFSGISLLGLSLRSVISTIILGFVLREYSHDT